MALFFLTCSQFSHGGVFVPGWNLQKSPCMFHMFDHQTHGARSVKNRARENTASSARKMSENVHPSPASPALGWLLAHLTSVTRE